MNNPTYFSLSKRVFYTGLRTFLGNAAVVRTTLVQWRLVQTKATRKKFLQVLSA
jgi:hypothetical protein